MRVCQKMKLKMKAAYLDRNKVFLPFKAGVETMES